MTAAADKMAQAKAFAKQHLTECVREIIEWQDTGLLRDGRLRELGKILAPMDQHYYMRVAESIVTREALDAHEAEQAAAPKAEAVAEVYGITAQNRTDDAYATVRIIGSAGRGYWDLPVRAGTKLYAAPQPPAEREPLSIKEIIAMWGGRSDGPSNAEIVSYCRAIERAHGIDTK